jgi:hypothetical protein
MAAPDRQHDALQTIFSFFLGLMVVAFIGVGVNTFYPQPQDRFQKELQPLQNEMNTVYQYGKPDGSQTPTQTARIAELQKQIDEINLKQQAEMENWGRNTSIILVLFATLVMGISLIRSDQLRVVSNGLLLGGLFTMIYGAGWTIASGTSYLRFFVVLFALVVAIALGYAKFVWLRPAAATALEARTNAAAAALGRREGA